MAEVQIVRLGARHIDGITGIERECFTRPWSREAFYGELINPSAVYFTALDNGSTVGFGGMHYIIGEGYITNIAVTKSHRGLGIGGKLLWALESYCVDKGAGLITLEVRISNTAAIELYKKHGFTIAGERKNFYEQPVENAYIMTKFFIEEESL